MKLEIKNLKELPFTTWSGGTTTQLFIKPENFTVKDDFDIRISSATIDPGDSTFSDFSKYNRFLTILDGWIDIAHPGEEEESCKGKRLEKHIPYYFDGAIKTTSSSPVKVIDFNVIWKKSLSGIEVNIFDFSKNTELGLKNGEYFIFSLENNGEIVLFGDKFNFLKGDFIKINLSDVKIEVEGKFIFVKI